MKVRKGIAIVLSLILLFSISFPNTSNAESNQNDEITIIENNSNDIQIETEQDGTKATLILDKETNEISLVTNEQSESSVANEQTESLVANEQTESSVANEQTESSVANEQTESSVANEQTESSVTNEQTESSVANEQTESSVT
ncbi:hypothetical protein, partial [Lysinibacillus xylanilyticus]|uniref:hypothetical protein n=1 Tax=Lysinibacillus xylanilyticus TaxID=582475 RepID=UPI0036D7E327